jgi:hypothetical protein
MGSLNVQHWVPSMAHSSAARKAECLDSWSAGKMVMLTAAGRADLWEPPTAWNLDIH